MLMSSALLVTENSTRRISELVLLPIFHDNVNDNDNDNDNNNNSNNNNDNDKTNYYR